MNALQTITDLFEDPKDNGDYELHLKGDDLRKLFREIEWQDKMLRAVVAATSLEDARRRASKGLVGSKVENVQP